ncbi:MAG: metal-dependent hydrolase [Neisseriaceae bacterium]|nr:metal-dependent hydrolase [Neisseriaceae bacterium]
MDSVTHLVLSGAGAAAWVPKTHRRTAVFAGMALGTLPDLDIFLLKLLTNDPIRQMVEHRGFSHSLLLMPLVVCLLWWGVKKMPNRVALAPWRWLLALEFALISHLLLDALTGYGTQLWWPFKPHPTMGASIYIIDPLYTLILLVTSLTAWLLRKRASSHTILIVGLLMSMSYLGFALVAKSLVERAAHLALTPLNLQSAPRFSIPLPFNALLWRVTVLTPEGYLIGDRSIISDQSPMRFYAYNTDVAALNEVREWPAVQQLYWFNRGFMTTDVVGNSLILKDLRSGLAPYFFFSFVIAEKKNNAWLARPPVKIKSVPQLLIEESGGLSLVLRNLWRRIWHEQRGLLNSPNTEPPVQALTPQLCEPLHPRR